MSGLNVVVYKNMELEPRDNIDSLMIVFVHSIEKLNIGGQSSSKESKIIQV